MKPEPKQPRPRKVTNEQRERALRLLAALAALDAKLDARRRARQ